jgi:hypothetical protein
MPKSELSELNKTKRPRKTVDLAGRYREIGISAVATLVDWSPRFVVNGGGAGNSASDPLIRVPSPLSRQAGATSSPRGRIEGIPALHDYSINLALCVSAAFIPLASDRSESRHDWARENSDATDQGLTPQKRGFGEFERSIHQAKAEGHEAYCCKRLAA